MGAQHDGTRIRRQSTSENNSIYLCRQKCVLSPAVLGALVSATAAHGRCGERADGRDSVCVIAAFVPVLGPVLGPGPAPLLHGPPD